jgi:glutaredoxin
MYYLYSKNDCKFCKKAVDLLETNFIEYRTIYPDIHIIELFKTQYKHFTYPFIFEETNFIGGYNDLENKFNF